MLELMRECDEEDKCKRDEARKELESERILGLKLWFAHVRLVLK